MIFGPIPVQFGATDGLDRISLSRALSFAKLENVSVKVRVVTDSSGTDYVLDVLSHAKSVQDINADPMTMTSYHPDPEAIKLQDRTYHDEDLASYVTFLYPYCSQPNWFTLGSPAIY